MLLRKICTQINANLSRIARASEALEATERRAQAFDENGYRATVRTRLLRRADIDFDVLGDFLASAN